MLGRFITCAEAPLVIARREGQPGSATLEKRAARDSFTAGIHCRPAVYSEARGYPTVTPDSPLADPCHFQCKPGPLAAIKQSLAAASKTRKNRVLGPWTRFGALDAFPSPPPLSARNLQAPFTFESTTPLVSHLLQGVWPVATPSFLVDNKAVNCLDKHQLRQIIKIRNHGAATD